ncbi:hypothetical protein V2S66_29300 [Streptomyces sp. V4-01]|uniref:Aminoglycoside phosphotransferase n=1 Tax=Actinacidiphila polyblastidii TaxID=3110430 RepID=A0ABU7PJN1_9ACTN|nr:hypothetical protein [Streptomyces sp. V4-01]
MTAGAAAAGPAAESDGSEPAAVPVSVAAALGAASPADRSFTRLTHSQLSLRTGGVWRVTGPAGSAVLKRCGPGGAGTGTSAADPWHWSYGPREALAYRDGLASTAYAAAGIDCPRLLTCEEHSGGSFDLWLEDVSGLTGARWPVHRLAAFGHALGVAQAPWTERLPDRPWLSRRWLRQYVEGKAPTGPVPWDHPTAVAVWPEALRGALRRMWEQRDRLLSAAESGPRTLCHLDVWPLNLIAADGAAGPARTVLLDWAFVGEGGVGEDIANLIPDCVADGLMPTEQLAEISEAVTAGYLAGLRDAGRRTDEDDLRRRVAAAGAAKYTWLAPLMLARLASGTGVGSPSYDVGGDDSTVMRRRIGLFEHLTAWAATVLDRS